MDTSTKWIIGIVVAIGLSWLVISGIPTTDQIETASMASQKSEISYPEPTNYAVDSAEVLTSLQLSDLNEKLKGIDNGTRQYAVLIVKTTAPLSIEQYAIKLAEK